MPTTRTSSPNAAALRSEVFVCVRSGRPTARLGRERKAAALGGLGVAGEVALDGARQQPRIEGFGHIGLHGRTPGDAVSAQCRRGIPGRSYSPVNGVSFRARNRSRSARTSSTAARARRSVSRTSMSRPARSMWDGRPVEWRAWVCASWISSTHMSACRGREDGDAPRPRPGRDRRIREPEFEDAVPRRRPFVDLHEAGEAAHPFMPEPRVAASSTAST